MSPWLSIVLLGVAITGYAWMMPKTTNRPKDSEFVSEAAYNQLLEDLETENRELVDAVAKFKREQDETVDRLGRRIVDMEHQLKKWSEQSPPALATMNSNPPLTITPSFPANEIYAPTIASESLIQDFRYEAVASEQSAYIAGVETSTEPPPTTIRGRYPELLEMHDRGRSVDQIAKAIGMNKGEVQLILQLARREDQQHA